MKRQVMLSIVVALFLRGTLWAQPPAAVSAPVTLGPYEYETKPDHEAFRAINPRKAPAPGPLLLQEGDRLAICGDSITEHRRRIR